MAVFNDTNVMNHLTTIGYQHREVKSEKKYFVNKNGCQVRVGNDGITLLSKYGIVQYKNNTISSIELEGFSKINE